MSLVLSEMESSALMSMNVITIHATQMQSAKTQAAAINAIVNKVIKAMVILVLMLMNVEVTTVVIEMPDVKTLLDHTYVNVLLDILVACQEDEEYEEFVALNCGHFKVLDVALGKDREALYVM